MFSPGFVYYVTASDFVACHNEQVVRCLVLGHPDIKFRRTAPRKPISLTEL